MNTWESIVCAMSKYPAHQKSESLSCTKRIAKGAKEARNLIVAHFEGRTFSARQAAAELDMQSSAVSNNLKVLVLEGSVRLVPPIDKDGLCKYKIDFDL